MLISSGFTNMKPHHAIEGKNVLSRNRIAEPGTGRKPVITNQQITSILLQYQSHGLDDLTNAGLMNRVDTKYLLPVSDLENLLRVLSPFYKVLEIDSSRIFSYRNTYFDTPEFRFYLMHHNGKLNRFKIRHRLYVDSGDLYVELKHKTNKRITQKDRVLVDGGGNSRKRINTLVSRSFDGSRMPLFKSLVCSYTRIALANENNGERVTLDFNLSFADPNQIQSKKNIPVLIAEVKRANRKAASRFIDLMERFRNKPVSFSKYCIGCAQIHAEKIKTNRFKETLLVLYQISKKESMSAAQTNNLLN